MVLGRADLGNGPFAVVALATLGFDGRREIWTRNELTAALKSLIAVSENYPQLKSDQNFRDLQAQLEGTENRIAVARNRYIESVQQYNVTVRQFPTNLTAMLFKYQPKANFTVENEAAIARPPAVDFGTGTAAPAGGAAAPAPAPAPSGGAVPAPAT